MSDEKPWLKAKTAGEVVRLSVGYMPYPKRGEDTAFWSAVAQAVIEWKNGREDEVDNHKIADAFDRFAKLMELEDIRFGGGQVAGMRFFADCVRNDVDPIDELKRMVRGTVQRKERE